MKTGGKHLMLFVVRLLLGNQTKPLILILTSKKPANSSAHALNDKSYLPNGVFSNIWHSKLRPNIIPAQRGNGWRQAVCNSLIIFTLIISLV